MTRLDPRIQQVLDGELPREALPPELRAQVERLERAAAMLSAVPARSVAERVMAEIRRPEPGVLQRLAAWLGAPREVRIRLRPAWSLAVLALLTLVAVLPWGGGGRGITPRLGDAEGVAHFVGHFPGARSVEVAGSFNDWRPAAIRLRDEDRDGIWHGAVVLPAGQHEYMFVVDGERWVADPLAGRYVDDGFGRENALLIVRPARSP